MPRIATCGWLMIGIPNSAPNTPGLVIVNVPPGDFVGLELFGARAVGQVGDRAARADEIFFVGLLDDRHDQAPVERDRDADVDVLVIDDRCRRRPRR